MQSTVETEVQEGILKLTKEGERLEEAKNGIAINSVEKEETEGGERKTAFPELEEELVAWIDSLRAKNLGIIRANIQRKATELNQDAGIAEFKASKG